MKKMAIYVTLKNDGCDVIRTQPFTEIWTKPSWFQRERISKEAAQILLGMNVSYDCASDYGLLAEI